MPPELESLRHIPFSSSENLEDSHSGSTIENEVNLLDWNKYFKGYLASCVIHPRICVIIVIEKRLLMYSRTGPAFRWTGLNALPHLLFDYFRTSSRRFCEISNMSDYVAGS
jgi:hypothetical protein